MFNKILIANRGEIACRIIKTARRMGVRTVAVYSDADKNARHVKMADEAIHIGPSPSRESYLVGEKIIAAALKAGAQAIHPGYGFLSENDEFCELCADNNLVFIGPPVPAIQAMGSKSAAKDIMGKANVPLVPGYHGSDQNPVLLKQSADDMGYPVLLKAVAGGGGKGMRQVWSADEFDDALAAAKREAKSSFNNDDMLVEKYLTQPRHVEVQVFCDQQGNGVYLFERDCSVQRRHQKIIEEAPAPNMPEGLREVMGDTAVRAALAIDYQGAGTVEFLLDADGSFYFMEMNTRLQVEHPVSEMITGQDLVQWQLLVAAGEPLPKTQDELRINGHSFEARIYAEDPDNDFLPATGTLHHLQTPIENKYVRIDTGVLSGDEVSIYYDPMIAKLIVWDEDRERALSRLALALRDYQISGITTNINFLHSLATHPAFIEADLDTGFIEKHNESLFAPIDFDQANLTALASLYILLSAEQNNDGASPWTNTNDWRLNATNQRQLELIINQQETTVTLSKINDTEYEIKANNTTIIASGNLTDKQLRASVDGFRQTVTIVNEQSAFRIFTEHGNTSFSQVHPDYGQDNDSVHSAGFRAPMNGTVINVLTTAGSTVKQGDTLLIMEAMKMEHAICAPSDGLVEEIYYASGDLVDGGSELLAFKADS